MINGIHVFEQLRLRVQRLGAGQTNMCQVLFIWLSKREADNTV